MRMTKNLTSLLALGLTTITSMCSGSVSGLNTIPTTDIVPTKNWVSQFQNGNTSFHTPAYYLAPNMLVQTQFGLMPTFEAGVDWTQPPDLIHRALVGNFKVSLQGEDDWRPGAAGGLMNITPYQNPTYFVSLSKTLNYAQQQEERFKAHHRRNRKLLGRRVHAGMLIDGQHKFRAFAGTDWQLSESAVVQADWIEGPGNSATIGFVFVAPDQKTTINPCLMMSNGANKPDGFFINIGRQLNF